MLLITHDMALVSENCDRIAVMYAGKIVELGGPEVFEEPLHPYTMGLVNAFPKTLETDRDLVSIPGAPPSLIEPPKGCRFRQRCPFAAPQCEREPPLAEVLPGRFAACHFTERATHLRARARDPLTWQGQRAQLD
jgi:oligopeptide/dipeptide ABC transporter ATP-binding protein